MPWVKLSDDAADHPDVAQAGAAALGLLVAAIGYSNRQATDGFIPGPIADRLIGAPEALAAAVERKLLERVEKTGVAGFRIAERYVLDQPTAAEIQHRRKIDRERQQRCRAARARSAGEANEGGSVTQRVTRDRERESRTCHASPDPDPFVPPKPPKGGVSLRARRHRKRDNVPTSQVPDVDETAEMLRKHTAARGSWHSTA